MEFERENDIMDQRQEMMDDAIDDVTGLEDEEEGEEVVNQVLDEIGVDLNSAVSHLAHPATFFCQAQYLPVPSLVRLQPEFSRQVYLRSVWLRPKVVLAVQMTICKPGSTV